MDVNEAMEKAAEALGERETTEAPVEAVAEAAAEPAEQTGTTPETAPVAGPARAPDGKFTKAEKATEKGPAAPKGDVNGAAPKPSPAAPAKEGGAATSPASPSAAVGEPLKAPSSLKPAAREEFAKAPRVLQEDIIRVDREVRATMQRAAEATKIASQVQQTLAPFESIARANNMDVMGFAGSVMQTAATLQVGTAQQKAAVIAQVIQQYGIDVEQLAAALDGKPQAHTSPQVDPRQIVRQEWEALQAEQERKSQEEAIRAFLATDPEFLDDVMPDMIQIAKAFPKEPPDRWYARAVRMSEDVAKRLEQRKAAEKAKQVTASTQASREAAVSLKSQPGAPITGKPKGIDEAMHRAAEKLGM